MRRRSRLPQLLLCGLFVPREAMPAVLEAVSDVLPLSYAVDGMRSVAESAELAGLGTDLAVIAAFVVAALTVGAATLRRRTA